MTVVVIVGCCGRGGDNGVVVGEVVIVVLITMTLEVRLVIVMVVDKA